MFQQLNSKSLDASAIDSPVNEARWKRIVSKLSWPGTALVANPLIWPSLPHKAWFGVDYAPLRGLRPSHFGECWVVFACKNPPVAQELLPLRTDGVILPLQWRREGDCHDARLPVSLQKLADTVKDQLEIISDSEDCVYKPREFFLHMAQFPNADLNNFLEQIKSLVDGDGATGDSGDVGSAWGALCTGLYFAVRNKVPPATWPFSSIAYDMDAKSIKNIGYLKEKLSAVADFQIRQFVLADEGQAKEAANIKKQLEIEWQVARKEIKKKRQEADAADIGRQALLDAQLKNLKARMQAVDSIDPVQVKQSDDLRVVLDDLAEGYARKRKRNIMIAALAIFSVFLAVLCFWQHDRNLDLRARTHFQEAQHLLLDKDGELRTDAVLEHLGKAFRLSEAQALFLNTLYSGSWLVPCEYPDAKQVGAAWHAEHVQKMIEKVQRKDFSFFHVPDDYPVELSISEGKDIMEARLKEAGQMKLWQAETKLDFVSFGDVSPFGDIILLEGLDGKDVQLCAFQATTGRRLWTRPLSGTPSVRCFSKDGELFCYVNQQGRLHVLDLRTGGNEYEPVNVGQDIDSMRFSEDGSFLLLLGHEANLKAFRFQHRFPRYTVIDTPGYSSAVYDSEQKLIYAISNLKNKLVKINARNMQLLDSMPFDGMGDMLRLSPDGNRLIMTTFQVSNDLNVGDRKKIGDDVAKLKQMREQEAASSLFLVYMFDLPTCFETGKGKSIQSPFMPDMFEFSADGKSCLLAGITASLLVDDEMGDEPLKNHALLRWKFDSDGLEEAFPVLHGKDISDFAQSKNLLAVNYDGKVDFLSHDGTLVKTLERDRNPQHHVVLTDGGLLIKITKNYRQLAVYDALADKELWRIDGYSSTRETSKLGTPFAVDEAAGEIAVAVSDQSIQRFRLRNGEKIGNEVKLGWVATEIAYSIGVYGRILAVGGNDVALRGRHNSHFALIDCHDMNIVKEESRDGMKFISILSDQEGNLFMVFDDELVQCNQYINAVGATKPVVSYLWNLVSGHPLERRPDNAVGAWKWILEDLLAEKPEKRQCSMDDQRTFEEVLPSLIADVPNKKVRNLYLAFPKNPALFAEYSRVCLGQLRQEELARLNPELSEIEIRMKIGKMNRLERNKCLQENPLCQYILKHRLLYGEKVFPDSQDKEFQNIQENIRQIVNEEKSVVVQDQTEETASSRMVKLLRQDDPELKELFTIAEPWLKERLEGKSNAKEAYDAIYSVMAKIEGGRNIKVTEVDYYHKVFDAVTVYSPFLPDGFQEARLFFEKCLLLMGQKSEKERHYLFLCAVCSMEIAGHWIWAGEFDKAKAFMEEARKQDQTQSMFSILGDLFALLVDDSVKNQADAYRKILEWSAKKTLTNQMRDQFLSCLYQKVTDINRDGKATEASRAIYMALEEFLKNNGVTFKVLGYQAAELGWKNYDKIFEVAGHIVNSESELLAVITWLKTYKPGSKVMIRLHQEGKTIQSEVDLGKTIGITW